MVQLEPLDDDLMPTRLGSRARENGHFLISGVAPGRYWLHAKDRQVRLDFGDPSVRARYARFGKEIEVRPGETVSVNLKAIR